MTIDWIFQTLDIPGLSVCEIYIYYIGRYLSSSDILHPTSYILPELCSRVCVLCVSMNEAHRIRNRDRRGGGGKGGDGKYLLRYLPTLPS